MFGVVALLHLTLWAATVSAFFPFFPNYLCVDDHECLEPERRSEGAGNHEDGLLDRALEALGTASFPLVRVRRSTTNEKPEARAARAAERLVRKYGSVKGSRTVQPPPDLVKRSNQYSIVSAAVPTQTNSVGIDQDGTDFSYFIQTTFGSAQTPIYMLLDTGAGTTWVMGTNCPSPACGMHNTFGAADSKSFQPSANNFSIAYGSGSVSGKLGTDVFAVGSLKVTMSFGVANQTSDDFKYFPFDGILGLSMNRGATDNFVQVVQKGKLLASNVYGVSIGRNADGPDTGEVTFGGVDAAKYTGQITYTPVSSSGGGDWAIPFADLAYNGKNAGITGRIAYIDTGTSYCFGPATDVAALHKLIPGAASADNITYTVPCTSTQPLTVTFSGATYTISPKDWISAPSSAGVCTSNFYGHEVVTGAWLLGDVFLKNVYAVFDADKSQIGFANKPPSPSPSGSTKTTATVSGTGLVTLAPSASSGTPTHPGLSGHETSATAVGETAAPSSSKTATSPGEQLEGNAYVSIICIIAVVAMIA